MRRLALAGPKGAAPEDRLGIFEITADQKPLLASGGGEVDDEHLLAEAIEEMIAGVDDAAGGVEDKFVIKIFFKVVEDFVKGADLLGEVGGFALGISWTVGPAHPGGDAVDA